MYSKMGLRLTEQFEGCRLAAYQDVRGVWTIGYGHTANVKEGMVCTQEQAAVWLDSDEKWAEKIVQKLVHVRLTQGEFDALVDFIFNVGSGNFLNSTMLKKLNAGDYAGAADEFEKWDHAGSKVIPGLLRRRVSEAQG